VLNISPRTAEKVASRHQLTGDEIRDAVVCVSGLTFAWHMHPQRGERAIVSVQIRGRPALIVLYPTADAAGDVWNLGSAYFVDV
jgi:hypothetical protein